MDSKIVVVLLIVVGFLGYVGGGFAQSMGDPSTSGSPAPVRDESSDLGSSLNSLGSNEPSLDYVNLSAPTPEAVSTDQSGSEFQVTVQNTGQSGDVVVQLYFWDENSGIGFRNYTKADSKELYFESGERRTVSINADSVGFDGYRFILSPETYQVTLKNDGGAGNVRVWLSKQDGKITSFNKSQIVHFKNSGVKSVTFDGEPPSPPTPLQDDPDVSVHAKPVNS